MNQLERFDTLGAYVQSQEQAFKREISVYDGWSWSFTEHLKQSLFYLFGRLMTGNSENKPVKNIVRRILKFKYAAEDIDVKNINIYVNSDDKYHLSFLVKKYHDEVYVKENKLDDFFDTVKKEKINFGGALVQRVNGKPVKVPLQNIAFCDQSNIMGAPFGIRLSMNPQELMERAKKGGWGNTANGATMTVEELITLAEYQKDDKKDGKQAVQTPGKYVDVYQVWGMLPAEFIGGKEGEFSLQLHFIAFIKGKEMNDPDVAVTLFAKEDTDTERFKFIKQDNGDGLENRALGYGGVEELFEAQAWTNSSMIWKMDYLRAASKILLQTTDPAVAARHPSGLKDLDNLELIEVEDGKNISQVDTMPRNFQLFDNSVTEWENYAQGVSFATNPMLGEAPTSGTPFRSLERQVIQGKAPHEENVKEYARFIEEIYNDWIIPQIAKEITRGTKFLATLSSDELEFVVNKVVIKEANQFFFEATINGKVPTQEELANVKQQSKEQFFAGGNKKFIEILKDEMKDISLSVQVDVAGKQKDLGAIVDKLSNILRQVFTNPAVLNDPRAAKIFQKIVEYSGLDQLTFDMNGVQPQQVAQQISAPQPTVAPVVA